MHPYRVIVRTSICSDSVSTIPDYLITLTHQSVDTNNSPRDPLHGPVTCNPSCFTDTLCLCLQYRHLFHHRNRHEHTATQQAHPLPHLTLRREPCHWHRQFHRSLFQPNLTHDSQFDQIQFFKFNQTRDFRFDQTHFFFVRLDSIFLFDSNHVEHMYFRFESPNFIIISFRLQVVPHWTGCL